MTSSSLSCFFVVLFFHPWVSSAKSLVEWLNEEGASILVICGTSLLLFIIWFVVCMAITKGLYIRGMRMRKRLLLQRLRNSRNVRDYQKDHIPVVSVVEDDDNNDNKDDELGALGALGTPRRGSGRSGRSASPNAASSSVEPALGVVSGGSRSSRGSGGSGGSAGPPAATHVAMGSVRKDGKVSMSRSLMASGDSDTEVDASHARQHGMKMGRKDGNDGIRRGLTKSGKYDTMDDVADDDYDNLDSIRLPEDVKRGVRHRAETFGGIIRNFGSFFIVMITLLQILDTIDVATNSLLIATTLVGFSISLGFYTVISDFACGLFILSENQFFKGEYVVINGIAGTVESQSLRLTTIRSRDGRLHIFSNGSIRRVTNCSRDFAIATVFVTVPYKTESDFVAACACLENVVSRAMKLDKTVDFASCLEDPQVDGIDDMNDSLIRIGYSIKVVAGAEHKIQQAMMKHIRVEFAKNEIYLLRMQAMRMDGSSAALTGLTGMTGLSGMNAMSAMNVMNGTSGLNNALRGFGAVTGMNGLGQGMSAMNAQGGANVVQATPPTNYGFQGGVGAVGAVGAVDDVANGVAAVGSFGDGGSQYFG